MEEEGEGSTGVEGSTEGLNRLRRPAEFNARVVLACSINPYTAAVDCCCGGGGTATGAIIF